jgi:hypothetical protein
MISDISKLKQKLSAILPVLNEKQRRLIVGAEALSIGRGGVQVLSNITGMSRPTIRRGVHELHSKNKDTTRVRTIGGGRKKAIDKEPKIKRVPLSNNALFLHS